MDARCHVIDAFLDGDRIDADALKRALTEESCRDYLVDTLALREAIVASGPTAREMPRWRPGWRRFGWPAAAVILLGSLAGGFAAGYRSAGALSAVPRAPAPIVAAPPVNSPSAPVAPKPTRVIRLEQGIDWKEIGGGE
jgi:hypothetical protein